MAKEKRIIKKLINPLFIFEFDRIRVELPIETHKEEIEDYLNGLIDDGSWYVYNFGINFIVTQWCKRHYKFFEIFNDKTFSNHKIVNFKKQKEAFAYIEKTTKKLKMKQRIYNLMDKKFTLNYICDPKDNYNCYTQWII